MHCKLEKPLYPKCSLYAKTFKKTQIPIYDALGPFPDEILMSSIDRVLFLFGAQKIQRYFNSEKLNEIMNEKEMEICDQFPLRNTPTHSVLTKSDNCSNKSLSFRKSYLSQPSSMSARIAAKDEYFRQDSGKVAIPLRVLKHSFSMCSLACRKIKEKLSFAPSRTLTMPILSPQWLWTKVESYADGCQVYEVFKNSSTCSHPTKFDTSKAAKIIFVILPTGIIMPFETLIRH